jgi:hypothetical protein
MPSRLQVSSRLAVALAAALAAIVGFARNRVYFVIFAFECFGA